MYFATKAKANRAAMLFNSFLLSNSAKRLFHSVHAKQKATTQKGIPDSKAKDRGTLQTWTLYRARPEIARVEARSVWNGKFGEWTEGVVDNGFAYTEVQVDGMFGHSDQLKQEVRAFDADGKPVPVQL